MLQSRRLKLKLGAQLKCGSVDADQDPVGGPSQGDSFQRRTAFKTAAKQAKLNGSRTRDRGRANVSREEEWGVSSSLKEQERADSSSDNVMHARQAVRLSSRANGVDVWRTAARRSRAACERVCACRLRVPSRPSRACHCPGAPVLLVLSEATRGRSSRGSRLREAGARAGGNPQRQGRHANGEPGAAAK